MNRAIQIVCVAVVLVGLGSAAMAVEIETVPVGNPGNPDDTHGDGYGGVDYEYNIGKYEVTAGQYCEFLNAVAKTDTYGLYNVDMDSNVAGCKITRHGTSGGYTYDFSGGMVAVPGSTATDWANRPVNYVSWGDAARFANWLHNGQPTDVPQDADSTEDGSYTLNGATSEVELMDVVREDDATWVIPTEDEWYKAAYYDPSLNAGAGGYYDYPTSSDNIPSNNLDLSGNNATCYDNDGGGHTIGSPYFRTEVGAHENSDSPYGTFDQGGNVFEWNEAIIDWLGNLERGIRGESFFSPAVNMHAGAVRPHDDPTYERRYVGFRVAEVPEPGTLSLLALVGLAVLRRRKCGAGKPCYFTEAES